MPFFGAFLWPDYSLKLIILAFIKTLKNIIQQLKNPFKWLLLSSGVIFLIIFLLSFTTIPFWMYYNLSVSEYELTEKPEYIIIMSGGGIPSESGLMRTYRAAELANKLPYTKIIVTMPGDTTDTTSACYLMKKELIIRGISENRISFENTGTNTRSQALAVRKMLPKNPPIIIVTSPEHIYRSLKTFHKTGLTNLTGNAAFSKPVKASFLFNDKDLGGNNVIPNIGNNTQFRYQFWSHLKFQIIVYREYTAIAFYKLKGWI